MYSPVELRPPTPRRWPLAWPTTGQQVRKRKWCERAVGRGRGVQRDHWALISCLPAEFRKSDRSLLLSPDGSSRVPFDPLQKPKCGVLKSPGLRRKTHASPAPKRRPTASDFFWAPQLKIKRPPPPTLYMRVFNVAGVTDCSFNKVTLLNFPSCPCFPLWTTLYKWLNGLDFS